MRKFLLLALLILAGCATEPLEVSSRLTSQEPAPLPLQVTIPGSLALGWSPNPIEDFVISQNADGYTGRDEYQDFAVGRLLSRRVEEYLATLTELDDSSANRALIHIEDVQLNYQYAWDGLEYVKLLVNASIDVAGNAASKVYYRQLSDQPTMDASTMLQAVFDGIAIEMGQDIIRAVAD